MKQNSSDFLSSILSFPIDNPAIEQLTRGVLIGTEFGLESLHKCKEVYDSALKTEEYTKVRYIVFSESKPPIMAFSGLLYPHFDFQGNQIQDIIDFTTHNEET